MLRFLSRAPTRSCRSGSSRARVAGAPAEIYGVADHPTYRDNWPLLDALPGVWDLVAAGDGVL